MRPWTTGLRLRAIFHVHFYPGRNGLAAKAWTRGALCWELWFLDLQKEFENKKMLYYIASAFSCFVAGVARRCNCWQCLSLALVLETHV